LGAADVDALAEVDVVVDVDATIVGAIAIGAGFGDGATPPAGEQRTAPANASPTAKTKAQAERRCIAR
jgi:hypothetical protein